MNLVLRENVNASAIAVRQPDIDALLCELRELYVGTGVRLAIEMGRRIVERIFGGDIARWRSRGRKDVSFRKLEKHPNLPFHASTLWRAVAIYVLSKRRNDLGTIRYLTPSHLNEIVGLSEAEQDRYLEKVQSERWSTRRLRQEITATRGRNHRRPHDPPAFSKWVNRIGADVIGRGMPSDIDAIERMGLSESRELLETTRKVLQQLEIVARSLGTHVRDLERNRGVPMLLPRNLIARQAAKAQA